MARKPETRRQKIEGSDEPVKSQIDRFKEAARRIGADDTGDALERAFRKIVPPKRRPKSDAEDDQG